MREVQRRFKVWLRLSPSELYIVYPVYIYCPASLQPVPTPLFLGLPACLNQSKYRIVLVTANCIIAVEF